MEVGKNEMLFMEQHRRFSDLMGYPPFSISLEKSREFQDALSLSTQRIDEAVSKVQDENPEAREKAFKNPYADLLEKYIDDIEEAELYQARYGEDILEAQAAALEIAGISPDDFDVPSL